jgi:hypothetical protein
MLDKEQLIEKGLISTKTNAIYDFAFIKTLKALPWDSWFEDDKGVRCQEDFKAKFWQWVHSSKLNKVIGLERFRRVDFINGTTQAFDETYLRYADRRLRVFRGEYAYHRRVFKNWKFLGDGELQEKDFVIISAPFCTTGDIHPEMEALLKDCLSLSVPVLVDCAYFGTCENVHIDVQHPAIEQVCFSLSKGIGLGDFRVGVRYSNFDDHYPICQQNNYQHLVHATAKVGLHMMENFGPDFIPEKYSQTQKEVCGEIGLKPTKCMHLALGDGSEKWRDFQVDDIYQRVGIRQLIKGRFKGLV